MKDLWIKISYYWFLFMLLIVGLFCGGLKANASTADYTFKQYRVQYYSLSTGDSYWTNATAFGTSTPFNSGYGVSAIAPRFGWSSKFQAGTNYRVVVEAGFSPSSNIPISFLNIADFNCYGSTSTSSWSADASLIATCDYLGATRVPNSNHVKYVFDITTLSTIIGLQFNIYFAGTSEVNAVNVYTKSIITYGEDLSGAINEQTIIIQDEIEKSTTEIIDAITENDKVCKTQRVNKYSNIEQNGCSLNAAGTTICSTSTAHYSLTKFYNIGTDTEILAFRNMQNNYSAFYDSSGSLISTFKGTTSSTSGVSITIPNNAKYVRFSVGNNYNYDYYSFKTCGKSGEMTTSSIDDINNTLTNDNVDNPSSSIEDMQSLLPSNGTITSLIALPINLYTKVLNSINGTCSSFNLGSLYGTNLIMPCIDISSYLGNTIWTTIDLILSGVFVLVIARKMIKAFNSFTFMKEGDVIND